MILMDTNLNVNFTRGVVFRLRSGDLGVAEFVPGDREPEQALRQVEELSILNSRVEIRSCFASTDRF